MRAPQRAAVLSALIALLPAAAAAQDAAASFERLRARVKAGDTLVVTTVDGREMRGKVANLTAAALELQADSGPTSFTAAEVRSISLEDSPWNGMFWGLAAGAVLGAVAEKSTADYYDEGSDGSLALAGGAVGAGLGYLIDAISRQKVIFSASSTAGRVSARVSLRW